MANPTPIRIGGLTGGLNTGAARDLIDLRQSPAMQNFTVKDGVAQKRMGYAAADKGTAEWVTGHFYHGHHYQDGVSGAKNFYAFGDREVMTAADPVTGWTTKKGAAPVFGSEEKNYYWNTTEIVDFDTYQNYLVGCYASTGRVCTANAAISSMDFKAVVGFESPTAIGVLLTGGDGYNAAADNNANHYCKRVINFADHLFLLHTCERIDALTKWVDLFQRIRWSNLAQFTASADWDDVNTAGAGYQDLKTDRGAILTGEKLRTSLIIYMEEAIVACSATNSSTAPFRFDDMITGLGLYAPRLMVSIGDEHIFVGNDCQFYRYYGGRDVEPIGDSIRTEFFTNMNMTASGDYLVRDRSWALHLPQDHAVLFALPTGSSDTYPTLFYLYFYRDRRWEKWDYATTLTGGSIWERPAGGSQNMLGIVGGTSMYQLNGTANDASTAVDAWIETKDFIIDTKNSYQTMDVWFEASGDGAASSVDVSLSVDGGVSFGTAQTVTIGTGWDLHHVNFGVQDGYLVRLKFRNYNDGTVHTAAHSKLLLGQVRAEVEEVGPA